MCMAQPGPGFLSSEKHENSTLQSQEIPLLEIIVSFPAEGMRDVFWMLCPCLFKAGFK